MVLKIIFVFILLDKLKDREMKKAQRGLLLQAHSPETQDSGK